MHIIRCRLLAIIALFVSVSTYAQDKIYKTDGGVLESKVKVVGVTSIVFKRFENPDGPEYTILKKEVSKIVYQNGIVDDFKGKEGIGKPGIEGDGRSKMAKKYGDNFISVTPAAYTVSVDGTINDVGVGLTYERLLDKRGHIGLNVPVMMCFASDHDFRNYTYYNSGTSVNYSGNYHSFFFMPGIKVYPARSGEAVRYSLGASLFCALGTEPMGVYSYNYNYTGGSLSNDTYHYTMFGFMISNSVNITAGKHVYMALDLAAGIPFSDNRHTNNEYGVLAPIVGPFLQFGFKVGYRY